MLTMRTLSLGSSSARLSSSSTTSQFSSPHLAPRGRSYSRIGHTQHPKPEEPSCLAAFWPQRSGPRQPGGAKGSGCPLKAPQSSPPGPAAPTVPGSVCLGHLLFDEVLCFLPGKEDPGTAGQRRHQAHLSHAITQAVSIHPAWGDASMGTGDSPAPSWHPSTDLTTLLRAGTPSQIRPPARGSAHPWAAQAGRPNIPGGIEPSSTKGLKLTVWKTTAPFLEMREASQKVPGEEKPVGEEKPLRAPFSPLGHVGQLPAGPGVAVAARFAAGVRGAAQLAVPL